MEINQRRYVTKRNNKDAVIMILIGELSAMKQDNDEDISNYTTYYYKKRMMNVVKNADYELFNYSFDSK